MTHMVGQTVNLGVKKRQPFVLAKHDCCVIRRQFSGQRGLARRSFTANEM
jgi:hypothetical protein